MDLSTCHAIVTGGASGLGAATASRVVAAGGKVTLLDRDARRGEAKAGELGTAARFEAVDVTDEDGMLSAIAGSVDAFGPLTLAVSCAGVGHSRASHRAQGRAPARHLQDGDHDQPGRHLQYDEGGRRCDAAQRARCRRQPRGNREYRLGRRLRGPARPGRVFVVQGRHRRADAAGGARSRPVRDPGDDHRPGPVPHPDDARPARRRAGIARRLDPFPQAPGNGRGVCRPGRRHLRQHHAQRRGDPARRRGAPRGALRASAWTTRRQPPG